MIPVVIPDRYVLSLLLHLPGIGCQLIDDCLFREEFVRWKLDRAFCRQHVAYRLLRLDQRSDLTLRQLEVRTQTVISNLVSLVN